MGWIVGCLIAWRRRIGALRQLRRFVELAPDAPSEVRGRCSELATQLRAGQAPRVVTADGTFSPFLWDPVHGPARIVIPEALLIQFSNDSLDAVLRHELIHLRRRDAWRHHVQFLVASLWWWLPTAALARRRLLRLEELCTDAAVVRANPDSANQYALALLDTEEFLTSATSRELTAVPAFTQGAFLRERIVSIVAEQPEPASQRRKMASCAVVATSLSLGFLTASLPPNVDNHQSSQLSTIMRSKLVPGSSHSPHRNRHLLYQTVKRFPSAGRTRKSYWFGLGLPSIRWRRNSTNKPKVPTLRPSPSGWFVFPKTEWNHASGRLIARVAIQLEARG